MEQHAPGVGAELGQKRPFGRREPHLLAAPNDAAAIQVNFEVERRRIAEQTTTRRGDAGRAAENRGHARGQFVGVEGFGQVVVGSGVEALQAVGVGRAGREQQHRRLIRLAAHPPQRLEAVDAGQHDIEHDQIGPLRL